MTLCCYYTYSTASSLGVVVYKAAHLEGRSSVCIILLSLNTIPFQPHLITLKAVGPCPYNLRPWDSLVTSTTSYDKVTLPLPVTQHVVQSLVALTNRQATKLVTLLTAKRSCGAYSVVVKRLLAPAATVSDQMKRTNGPPTELSEAWKRNFERKSANCAMA